MTETAENRLKRLKMRSWRRGMREMDLILGPFSDNGLGQVSPEELDIYELLLEEMDHDLYQWFSGQLAAPANYHELIDKIGVWQKA